VREDFDQLLFGLAGVIFLEGLGIALDVVGQYAIGSVLIVIATVWILSIYFFMKYIEKKDSENEENEDNSYNNF